MALTCWPIPIANGRPHSVNTPTIDFAQDTNLAKLVAKFADAVTSDLHFLIYIPANLSSGNWTLRLRWRANATSGDVRWQILHIDTNTGQQTNTNATTTVSVTSTTDATANDKNETEFTLSTGAGASRVLTFLVRRLGGDGADTLTAIAEALEIQLEYTSDPTITKVYVWTPANAFAIPSASGATRGTQQWGTSMYPQALKLRDAQSDYADARITLPANFLGNLKTTLVESSDSATGAFQWRIDAARSPVGSAGDPAFTTGTPFTSGAHGSTNTVRVDLDRAVPVTPVAGDTVIARVTRLGSDGSDANTGDANVWGLMWSYDVSSRNPGAIRLEPASGALPTSGSATIQQANDTNSSKFTVLFADAVDQKVDLLGMIPSIYASGGTLRIRWRTPAASGNAYFRVDVASPAVASASDPALTTGTPFTAASGGANVLNETTVDISSGIAASDNLNLRLNRLGSDGNDTLSNSLEVLDVTFEANVSAP